MSRQDIIRAWKDEEFRRGLTDDQRARLPEHPAGLIELTREDLGTIEGGAYKTLLACPHIYNLPC
jgi:mersacidin/lichenicidin family type 2 lantibiotic